MQSLTSFVPFWIGERSISFLLCSVATLFKKFSGVEDRSEIIDRAQAVKRRSYPPFPCVTRFLFLDSSLVCNVAAALCHMHMQSREPMYPLVKQTLQANQEASLADIGPAFGTDLRWLIAVDGVKRFQAWPFVVVLCRSCFLVHFVCVCS